MLFYLNKIKVLGKTGTGMKAFVFCQVMGIQPSWVQILRPGLEGGLGGISVPPYLPSTVGGGGRGSETHRFLGT